MTRTPVQELIRRYYAGAATNTDCNSTPDEANRAHDEMHDAYRLLRTTSEGREAISALMDDGNPGVRLWAAAHSLFWKPDRARAVLKRLAAEGGLLGFTAEMTLREFDAGRLTFDY